MTFPAQVLKGCETMDNHENKYTYVGMGILYTYRGIGCQEEEKIILQKKDHKKIERSY